MVATFWRAGYELLLRVTKFYYVLRTFAAGYNALTCGLQRFSLRVATFPAGCNVLAYRLQTFAASYNFLACGLQPCGLLITNFVMLDGKLNLYDLRFLN